MKTAAALVALAFGITTSHVLAQQPGSTLPATVFESGETQSTLIELFTSEGCSSCPPAEKWLSGLKSNQDLWKKIIPVAFHVDYWDRLGGAIASPSRNSLRDNSVTRRLGAAIQFTLRALSSLADFRLEIIGIEPLRCRISRKRSWCRRLQRCKRSCPRRRCRPAGRCGQAGSGLRAKEWPDSRRRISRTPWSFPRPPLCKRSRP